MKAGTSTQPVAPDEDQSDHRRLLEPIGDIRPAEAEADYYRQLAETVGLPV